VSDLDWLLGEFLERYFWGIFYFLSVEKYFSLLNYCFSLFILSSRINIDLFVCNLVVFFRFSSVAGPAAGGILLGKTSPNWGGPPHGSNGHFIILPTKECDATNSIG